jgi:hypothetical protein
MIEARLGRHAQSGPRVHKVARAVAQQRPAAPGQHLLLHHRYRVRIALGQEGADPAAVGDRGPVDGRVAEQHADLAAGRPRPVDRAHRPVELLVDRRVPGLPGGLRGVPQDRAQVGAGHRLAGDEPVHRVLVARVAELHDDIVDHLGQPRIGQQQLQRVVMVLQAVRLPDADQPVPGEGVQHHAGQVAAGQGHGLTLVSHAALQPATMPATDVASTLSQLPHGQ